MRHLKILFLFFITTQLIAQSQVGQSVAGEAANDFFGRSVDLSADGTTIAVGSRINAGGTDTEGEVQVYKLMGNTWTPVGQALEREVAALSSDGNIVAIGSPRISNNVFWDGRVSVFQLVNDSWEQIGQTLVGDDSEAEFGSSIDLSADGLTLIVGAYRDDTNGSNAGVVKVYSLVANTWIPLGQSIVGESAGDLLGFSVAISADASRIVVSSHGSDENGDQAGAVAAYELNGSNWEILGEKLLGESSGDRFGVGLDISSDGTTMVVGAPDNSAPMPPDEYVVTYRFDGTNWQQLGQKLTKPALGLDSGQALSISGDGNYIVTGGPAERDPVTNNFIGAVTAFELQGGNWSQYGNRIYGESNSSRWAADVSVSDDGQLFVSGASFHDPNGTSSGNVRVFNLSNTLPVVFAGFTATAIGKIVQLDWATSSELNSDFFLVEHRASNGDWEIIGRENASVNSEVLVAYTFTHLQPLAGINYYRIRQVDYDGSIQTTDALTVQVNYDNVGISVFPNPMIGNVLKVKNGVDLSGALVGLFSIAGKQIPGVVFSGDEIIVPDLLPGAYILRLITNDKEHVQMIVRE